jgi:DNA-binding transcriptional LysR family regulator
LLILWALAVAREGSISRAADRIGRAQPSVTMAIQKLERDLKTDFIERSGRGVRLTAAGRRLAEYLGPLLHQWDAARAHLDDSPDGPLRGPVRVGGGEAAMLYLLPPALAAFRR